MRHDTEVGIVRQYPCLHELDKVYGNLYNFTSKMIQLLHNALSKWRLNQSFEQSCCKNLVVNFLSVKDHLTHHCNHYYVYIKGSFDNNVKFVFWSTSKFLVIRNNL